MQQWPFSDVSWPSALMRGNIDKAVRRESCTLLQLCMCVCVCGSLKSLPESSDSSVCCYHKPDKQCTEYSIKSIIRVAGHNRYDSKYEGWSIKWQTGGICEWFSGDHSGWIFSGTIIAASRLVLSCLLIVFSKVKDKNNITPRKKLFAVLQQVSVQEEIRKYKYIGLILTQILKYTLHHNRQFSVIISL